MGKVNAKKEILVVLLIAVLTIALSTSVLATGSGSSQISIPGLDSSANATTDSAKPIEIITPSNQQKNANATTNSTTNATTNQTGSTYGNNTLPQTGDASDYAIFALIAVSAVVAVYAYKKVRDYNI